MSWVVPNKPTSQGLRNAQAQDREQWGHRDPSWASSPRTPLFAVRRRTYQLSGYQVSPIHTPHSGSFTKVKRLECINLSNFFVYGELHLSNRILSNTQCLKHPAVERIWMGGQWEAHSASSSPPTPTIILLRSISEKWESPTEHGPSLLWQLMILWCTWIVKICSM